MKFGTALLAGASLLVAVPALAQTATPGAGANLGLSGTFYKVPSGSIGFSVDSTLAQLANATPTGTFTSTTFVYNGNDGSSITDFLGVDAASYRGASNAGDLSDGIIELKGYFNVPTAGSFNFASNHDDNVQLTIGGQTILAGGCCGLSTGTAIFATPGLYAVDFVYANTNFYNVGGATVDLSTDAAGTFVQSVPEPATWAMMLLGFGMIGFGMRYRTRRTKVSFA